ncbi:hypothetical protein QRX50_14380 [Amycolatopsis carbonis]|uniref:Uncharacterized protein n=1 Tax=Amycolatopsis carbonis TaxID=715471 RepID=A0A9Y2IP06_9PSEU|nr:hypothetical protein [Amycolatopsis sp. 2-15]WIX81853.1 hypothetical protein QRX50_14380 [Amycolatopsis sp. 2-15]
MGAQICGALAGRAPLARGHVALIRSPPEHFGARITQRVALRGWLPGQVRQGTCCGLLIEGAQRGPSSPQRPHLARLDAGARSFSDFPTVVASIRLFSRNRTGYIVGPKVNSACTLAHGGLTKLCAVILEDDGVAVFDAQWACALGNVD